MRAFRVLYIAMVSLILTAACASNQATQATPVPAPDSKATAGRVDDVLSREIKPLQLHPVADDAHFFTSEVESTEAPQVTSSGGLRQVIIPIGTEQPVRCFVYPKAINLAQTLRLFVNSVVSHVSKHQIDTLDAGQLNGQPYLAVNTSYLVENDGQKGGGQVKYMAARAENSTTLCMLDEPGYVESFKRIASGFIAHEKFGENDADPSRNLLVWRAVSVQRSGKVSVGVIESRLYEGEAGYAFASSRSVLLPADDGTVVASDEAENQFSNADGDVLEAKYVKIINDTVAYNLGLSLDSKTSYKVNGTYQGASLDTHIKVDAAMRDFASQTAELRRLFASRSGHESLKWTTFSPTEPTKISTVNFEKKAGEGNLHQGVLISDHSKAQVELDEMGTQKRVITDDATVERVWQGSHS